MSRSNCFFVLFIIFISITTQIQINKLRASAEEVYAHNSQLAIKRIKERVKYLRDDTSCKVAAKFILFTLGNVKSDSDRNHLVLTHNNEIDFINMKDLLKRGYILQVEIKTNHHFILFQKNNDEYYFLQAFYTFYQLKDWLSYDEITTIKIDNFYDNMRIITNESYDKETRHQKILEMFYPPQINKGNQDKIKEFINYFDYNPCVTIINVDYVKYNFHIKNKGKIFDMAFREVDSHFLIY